MQKEGFYAKFKTKTLYRAQKANAQHLNPSKTSALGSTQFARKITLGMNSEALKSLAG